MPAKESEVKLKWTTDRASVASTLRANNQIEKSLVDTGKSARSATPLLDRLGKEGVESLRAIDKESRKAVEGLRDVEHQADKTSGAVAGMKPGGAGSGDTLGSIGKLESVTSGLTGLSGVAGLAPVGEAAGLIDAAGAAFSTMNPVVLATGAVLAGATAAFTLLNAQAKESIAEYNAQVDAQRELATAIGGGLTTKDAAEQVKQWNAELERQTGLLEQRAAEQEKFDTTLGKVADFTGLFGQIEAVNEQYTNQQQTVADLQAKIGQYNAALGDGSFATNDARAAEEELTQEREKAAAAAAQAAIQDAATAGELARVREESKSLYAEDIASRIAAGQLRKTQLEAELAALKATGDTSELVTNKIESLQKALGNLGEETRILKAAASQAPSREAEKAAEKAQQAVSQRAGSGGGADTAQRQLDLQRATQNRLADLQTQFYREEEKAQIDYYDKLDDIREKAQLEEGKAIEQRDFLRVADTRDTAKQEARELSREQERAHRDRLRELQYANNDVMLEQRRQLNELQNATRREVGIKKQGMTNTLNLTIDWVKALEKTFSRLPVPGGGAGAISSGQGLSDLAALL